MVFADLKNDFVFHRIFARHPDILLGLLNDLLGRRGNRAIESIEYLASHQIPRVIGAKFPNLGVRCLVRGGATFVAETQLLHIADFYNPRKACADQFEMAETGSDLAPVVVVSICNFILWPDTEPNAAQHPRTQALSRWRMTEPASGDKAPLQVQHVFLETPKAPADRPVS